MQQQQWRTVLFVPGDRPDRMARAGSRGADAVVVDLEDAVAPGRKDWARDRTVELIQQGLTGTTMVRVNAVDSGELERDVSALAAVLDRVTAVLLPKVEGPQDVARLEELLEPAVGRNGPALIPIVETPTGVFEVRCTAAASPRVTTLLFGPVDLGAELGVRPTVEGREFAHARALVVLAAASANLAAPLDGPHVVLGDIDGLTRSTQVARELGFGGRVVIHPEQIAVVRAGFGPRPDEVAWAEQVVAAAAEAAAAGAGVARLADGTFIDGPVARQARAILEHGLDTSATPSGAG